MTEIERRRLVVLTFVTSAIEDDIPAFVWTISNIDCLAVEPFQWEQPWSFAATVANEADKARSAVWTGSTKISWRNK